MKKLIAIVCSGLMAVSLANAEPGKKGDGDCKDKKGPSAAAEKGKRGGGPGGGDMFGRIDADGNGSVSLDEFKAAHAKRVEMMKKRMGDKYKEREGRPSAEEIFKKIDANSDGSLTKDEMGKMRGRRGHGQRGGGDKGGKRGKGGKGGKGGGDRS